MLNHKFLNVTPKKAAAIIFALLLGCFGAGDRKSASAEANPEHPSIYINGPRQLSPAFLEITLDGILKAQQLRWKGESEARLLQNTKDHLSTASEFHKSNPLPAISLILSGVFESLRD